MALSNEFKDAVEQGKTTLVKIMLKDSLLLDKSGREFDEMLAYAKRYQILLEGNTGSKELNACIYRLNRLETTVTRPYFLEVLRLYDDNRLTISQVTEIFLMAENYLFRRTICDLPTNALNKIFLLLHREIVRYDGSEDNYVEKVKYALVTKKERARFPGDEEFSQAFVDRAVYQMTKDIAQQWVVLFQKLMSA